MTQDDLTFLPLRVTRVGDGGKRSFDRADKQRLIDACLQPGASLSGLALKAGVNANQLRKWVQLREQSNAPVKDGMVVTSSAFVPVVAIDNPASELPPAPAPWPMPEPKRSPLSPRAASAARLSAQLPNGVKLELECYAGDHRTDASAAAQPLPGSNASAAMIATLTTGKYVDGTPLYRMAHALVRADIEVGRCTLANWIIRPAQLHYSRLYGALRGTLLPQPLIHGDETTVQVLKEPGKTAQSTSYMWVYRSAEDCPEPVVLFDYQPGRGREHPQAFLSGYEGLLMSDGYAAWRTLEGPTHFGCLAHARRAFVDALKGMKRPGGRAAQALEYFKALYQVETLAKADLPEGATRQAYTYRVRRQHSVPLLASLKAWLDEQAPQILPESLLGKAISYTRNHWSYLSRYVSDGRAPIGNNVIERDIRPFCTGIMAVRRYGCRSESKRNGLQPDAHVSGLQCRTLRIPRARAHRVAAACTGC